MIMTPLTHARLINGLRRLCADLEDAAAMLDRYADGDENGPNDARCAQNNCELGAEWLRTRAIPFLLQEEDKTHVDQ